MPHHVVCVLVGGREDADAVQAVRHHVAADRSQARTGGAVDGRAQRSGNGR
jgi:hypothetical protein